MSEIIVCAIKELPPDAHVAAAQRAISINPANRPHPTVMARALGDMAPTPERIALLV
jgi:hypothetical protein